MQEWLSLFQASQSAMGIVMFKKIVFVCVGNICRSPAAEYWARDQLHKAGFQDIQVSSAGLGAMRSSPIAPEMKTILDRYQIDSSAHIARQIEKNIVNDADIIFTMETWQKEELSVAFSSCRGKIFCLGKWTNEEVIDPYRKENAVFNSVFESIKKNWEIWQNKLWGH